MNSGAASSFMVVYGKVNYLDVFGVHHWTHYCQWLRFKPGRYTAKKCTDYNDVDRN